MKNEKINKKFISVFGNSYEKDILKKDDIINIINNINSEDVLEKLLKECPGAGTVTAFLNTENGEIEYHFQLGNGGIIEEAHLINIEEMGGTLEEGLTVEDFLSDEEIKEITAGVEGVEWDAINNLPDYEERLIDAWKFYYGGIQMERIRHEVDRIYQEQ